MSGTQTITLNCINISTGKTAAITITGTVTMVLVGNNTVTSAENFADLQVDEGAMSGVVKGYYDNDTEHYIHQSATITISGGTVTTVGGKGIGGEKEDSGSCTGGTGTAGCGKFVPSNNVEGGQIIIFGGTYEYEPPLDYLREGYIAVLVLDDDKIKWEVKATYTVLWENEADFELEMDENVPYGTMPSVGGTEPQQADDEQYTYAFTGWSLEISPVTGGITYTAVFEKTKKDYFLTWDFTGGDTTYTQAGQIL